jgi:hypothetical protein
LKLETHAKQAAPAQAHKTKPLPVKQRLSVLEPVLLFRLIHHNSLCAGCFSALAFLTALPDLHSHPLFWYQPVWQLHHHTPGHPAAVKAGQIRHGIIVVGT